MFCEITGQWPSKISSKRQKEERLIKVKVDQRYMTIKFTVGSQFHVELDEEHYWEN